MVNKIICSLLLFFFIVPVFVYASVNPSVRIGNKYYDTLEDAILNASSTDTITLISDVTLSDTLSINKTVNINLNGNDISSCTKVFEVKGGVLNIEGKGTIKELEPNYGVIMVRGSSNSSDKDYSIVNVGSDVILEGWSGIFINHDSSKTYGVLVNVSGSINAVDDINGSAGTGIYVNGNIRHQTNYPVVNILDGAKITSTGNGLYIAGYSTFNIKKAYISGMASGIGIKAGNLNVDGATVVCEGLDKTPSQGSNNGITPSGVAIQIESNNGYAGDMNIDIKSGDFTSKNSNVIYEYIAKGDTSLVDSMKISGGTFISKASKNVFRFSDDFKNKHNSFISGGYFSIDPSSYLKSGYVSVPEDDIYKVENVMNQGNYSNDNSYNEVISSNDSGRINTNKLLKVIVLIVAEIILIFTAYFNRKKIFSLLSKWF